MAHVISWAIIPGCRKIELHLRFDRTLTMKARRMSRGNSTEENNSRSTGITDLIATLEHQIEELLDLSTLGAYTTANDGTCLSITSQALRWIGCSSESIIGKKAPLLPRAVMNWDALQRGVAQLQSQGQAEIEVSLVDENSKQRFFRLVVAVLYDASGQPSARRSLFYDVTESKRYADRQRISAMAFDSQMGICITDQDWMVLELNTAFSKITGYSSADLRNQSFALFFSSEKDAAKHKEMLHALATDEQWEGEIRAKRKKGSAFTGWLNVSVVPAADSAKRYFVVCLYDITDRKATQDEINRLAFFDPLTELPNRRKLNERLARVLSVIPRSHLHGALLFVDLDKFKAINDTKGHAAGDELLIEVANRLQRSIRDGDMVARVGGDEFVVLLSDLSSHVEEASYQANLIGSKILKSLDIPYKIDDFFFRCSASIGIAMFSHESRAEDVFQYADMAMYRAKKEGGNSLSFFDPAMKAAAAAYSTLEQELRQVVDLNQLELFFQPQFDFEGKVLSAEALLRWNHPVRGLLGPDEFIAIAEESGLIVPMGLWVLQRACEQLKRWESGLPFSALQVSINISVRQFRDQDFAKKITQILAHVDIDPSRLKLELTESLMHNVDEVRPQMEKIRELGVRFALDDFGTGYSSLASLIQLPLEQLKIDRSFIANMLSSPGDGIIVKTIIAMAQSLGMDVIAEGLETEQEKEFLRLHGCSIYQGYLMSPPLPCALFEELVSRNYQRTEIHAIS
jgi:diguanylate cyclase (GGDEF)-like protein/PAS domain S-box-containing protein